jgi:hypothetical protein
MSKNASLLLLNTPRILARVIYLSIKNIFIGQFPSNQVTCMKSL